MAELSKEQESLVIDFLKRWGIESPELLVEMTDHYCEMAMEKIEKGWSFEKILDSWKTKPNYLSLRKIQAEYSKNFKKQWFQEHVKAFKKLFFTGQIIWLLIGVLGILGIYHIGLGEILSLLAVLYSITVTCLFSYLYYSEKYHRFTQTRESVMVWIGCYWLLYHYAMQGHFKSLWQGNLEAFNPYLLIFMLLLNAGSYNIFQSQRERLRGIRAEFLTEPEKFQRR
jgi:hypothetical protein